MQEQGRKIQTRGLVQARPVDPLTEVSPGVIGPSDLPCARRPQPELTAIQVQRGPTLRRAFEPDPAPHPAVIVGLVAMEHGPGPLFEPERRPPMHAQRDDRGDPLAEAPEGRLQLSRSPLKRHWEDPAADLEGDTAAVLKPDAVQLERHLTAGVQLDIQEGLEAGEQESAHERGPQRRERRGPRG